MLIHPPIPTMASLVITDEIRRILQSAALSDPGISKDVQSMATSCSTAESIPWKNLRVIVEALRRADPGAFGSVQLHQICKGSALKVASPPERVKNPELAARNAKLQERLDNMRYAEMVADVTVEERAAEERKDALLPSSRLQIGFGLQVLVTMFTFYSLGYVVTKYYLGMDELWAGLTGALGLTFGLLLETTLLIIRTNMPRPLHEKYPELFGKKPEPDSTGVKAIPLQQWSGSPAEAQTSASTKAGKAKASTKDQKAQQRAPSEPKKQR